MTIKNSKVSLQTLFAATVISACASAMPSAELQWEPASLSRQGCINLTGIYQDQGSLSQAFYAGLGGDKAFDEQAIANRRIFRTPYTSGTPSNEIYASLHAFNERSLLSIRHYAETLEITLKDNTGESYEQITIRLDTPMIGCYQGAMVLRWKQVGRRAEWGGGNIVWGEREIRKLDDGSLMVTYRKRQRSLSIVTGGATGDIRIWPETTLRYFPAANGGVGAN